MSTALSQVTARDFKEANGIIKNWLEGNRHSAIMIDGPWGCGKTWYVENILAKDCDIPKKTIRLSLFGIASVQQILSRIFDLTATNTEKTTKVVVDLVAASLKAATRIDLDNDGDGDVSLNLNTSSLKDLLAMKIGDLHGFILVLDDLERCEVASTLLAGFINGLIEDKGANILILGNSDELDYQPNDWAHLEKFVEEIVHVKGDVSAYLDFVLSQETTKLDDRYKEPVKKAILSTKIENLRHVRKIFCITLRSIEAIIETIEIRDDLLDQLICDLIFIETQIRSRIYSKISHLESIVMENAEKDGSIHDVYFGDIDVEKIDIQEYKDALNLDAYDIVSRLEGKDYKKRSRLIQFGEKPGARCLAMNLCPILFLSWKHIFRF